MTHSFIGKKQQLISGRVQATRTCWRSGGRGLCCNATQREISTRIRMEGGGLVARERLDADEVASKERSQQASYTPRK
uniref:HDC17530 n=1 Tax=Drosophila melanogaster TaxID=7227 RepID=Q6IIN1_DROME|nr:TPA_inf: HDC17530 [Drosophila melanogaster]